MVVVTVREGKLRGKTGEDIRGGKFYSFQGIPYATPPIGKLRFKAPQPPQPWTGIRDATEEGSESLSKDMFTKATVGSEDCLILNVYTPEIGGKPKPLRPVMFYIHGGIFATGSSKTDVFGPEFLVAEDVVLVTINYRLGVLGFLSLDDPWLGVPGNAGFKDMVMALKWVQRNIETFCGDPNNVTVFGESSGGAAAHLVMLSPMAKGLFHRVIAQGGSAFNLYVFGRRTASMIAGKLGFHNTDDRKLLEFLQSVPAEAIFKAQLQADSEDFVVYQKRHFGAVVERPCGEEAFISEPPLDTILSGNYPQVPLMMGFNSGDGFAFDTLAKTTAKDIYVNDFETSIPFIMNLEYRSKIAKAASDKIRNFYFQGGEVNRIEKAEQFLTLVTDTTFFRAVYSSARNHVKVAKEPVYFYRMSIETDLNIFKKVSGITFRGAYHADDLGYLFKTLLTPEIEPGSIEDIAQRRFTKLWANFARYGNPTPDKNDPLLKITWKPMEKDKFHFLDIDRELTMQINPEADRMALWDEVYKMNPATSKL